MAPAELLQEGRPLASLELPPIETCTVASVATRRHVLARGLAAALVVIARPAAAQQQAIARPARIGLLWIRADTTPELIAQLGAGMRAQGLQPGRDFVLDDRHLVGGYDELESAVQRLVAAGAAIIVTRGTTATEVASRTAPQLPIVSTASGDLVRLGVADSLARPGRNVTGFSTRSADAAGKRLEILRELVPKLRRFAVVLYPGSLSEVESLRNFEALARTLGVESRAVEIRDANGIEPAIATIATLDVQGVLVVASTLLAAHRHRVVAAIARLDLPAVYSNASMAEAGGLVAYEPDVPENYRRAGLYIDRLLKGARAADLPIEEPRTWLLVVNVATAKRQGLAVPHKLLLRADRVID